MRTSVREWCLTLLVGYPTWISAFLAGCRKTMQARQNVDDLYVWHNRRIFPQDAQKDRSARTQRANKDDISKLARLRCS